MRDNAPDAVTRARALRRTLSPPEVKLWCELRAQSPGRCPFRKQHPVGPYVLDFYAASARLAVEVDGYSHGVEDRAGRDARRDAWLALSHIEVHRIAASEVLRDATAIADGLLRLARERVGR